MERKEYNGWTNYETWNVKLWMDNDQGSQGYWEEATRDLLKNLDAGEKDTSDVADELAGRLESEHMESLPELTGFAADILNSAMSEVDWLSIAESLIEDNLDAIPEVETEADSTT